MTYDPEIEKLLPWYAKGLLEPEEHKQVEDYLEQNPEMRMQLDLIDEEISAVEQQHAALGAPAPGGLDRLMADIDAYEAQEAPLASAAGGLMDKVKGFFSSFSSPGMQFAAMAAAVVIVAQGVVISTILSTDPAPSASKPTFTTASGPEQAAVSTDVVFLVAFKKSANMGAVADLLKSQSAKIISGPKAGGFFEIAIPADKLPEGGAKAVVSTLKEKSDLVQFVSSSQ